MNATLLKFGYPATLLKQYAHWCVLLRPAQATLGALVLGSVHESTSVAALPPEAFAELATVTAEIEAALKRFRPFDKINYLCLMMVDPHVHFHVLPRYAVSQEFAGQIFPDAGWPGMPDLKSAPNLSETVKSRLQAAMMDVYSISM